MAGTGGTGLPLCIDDWQYRAEGIASFVIFNPKTQTILKMRKTSGKDSPEKVADDNWKPFLDYIKTMIEPLLGLEYVCLPTMVPVAKEFLQSVIRRFEPERPEKCLNTQVDITKSYVLSLPDSCFLPYPERVLSDNPTFCVEIKPKRGFLPDLRYVPDDLAIKYHVCRFCLHQHYKVRRNVWEKRSDYCPLDLFSCEPSRMKYTLNVLLENPQNNLRIFKDGTVIYQVLEKSTPSLLEKQELARYLQQYFGGSCSEEEINKNPLESSSVQAFLDVIIQALLSANVSNGMKPPVNRSRHGQSTCSESGYKSHQGNFPSTVKVEPSDKCILKRLLAAQSLSILEIDVILPLYRKVVQHLEENPQDSERYRLDFPYGEDFSFVDDETAMSLNALENEGGKRKMDVSGVGVQDAVQMIREFMITRTLKDCSLMLAIQPIPQEDGLPPSGSVPYLQTSEGRRYLYSASAVDLDPKPSSRIPMYEAVDRKVALEYIARHQNGVKEQL